jgi:hypothetical protein
VQYQHKHFFYKKQTSNDKKILYWNRLTEENSVNSKEKSFAKYKNIAIDWDCERKKMIVLLQQLLKCKHLIINIIIIYNNNNKITVCTRRKKIVTVFLSLITQ